MSSSAFPTTLTGSRWLPVLIVLAVVCALGFAQEGAKPKPSNAPGKKGQAAKSREKTAAAQTQEKTAEAAKAGESAEGDQEEPKGPWHGLTWRLLGPFRGGRVLAVNGVGGDRPPDCFCWGGGGGWEATEGGLSLRPV